MKTLLHSFRLLTAVCLILCAASAMAQVESVDSSRFEVNVLASGLIQPMELAVAPDGRVFFIELAGKLKMYDRPRNRFRWSVN